MLDSAFRGAFVWSPRMRGRSLAPDTAADPGPVVPAHAGLVPSRRRTAPRPRRWSPRMRGWSRHRHRRAGVCLLLPAPAGLVPNLPPAVTFQSAAPRTRGVGPDDGEPDADEAICSPHPRGWSRTLRRARLDRRLLPAPAGLVPVSLAMRSHLAAAPRTRGVGPLIAGGPYEPSSCSPHPRGWSRRQRPRSRLSLAAPRTRGVGPPAARPRTSIRSCSPHPRGWSPLHRTASCQRPLLPAPAGLVPYTSASAACSGPAPRTRGVGPARPRTTWRRARCSPHPRGWSHGGEVVHGEGELLPAPAGLVPIVTVCWVNWDSAPRTRGVGPPAHWLVQR